MTSTEPTLKKAKPVLDLIPAFIDNDQNREKMSWVALLRGDSKKIVKGAAHDATWTESEAQGIQGDRLYTAQRLLHLKDMVVVDIDVDVPLEEVYDKYPFLIGTAHCGGNSKGWHFYVKVDGWLKKNIIKGLKDWEGDIIVEQIFERRKEWFGTELNAVQVEELQSMLNPYNKDKTSKERTKKDYVAKIGDFKTVDSREGVLLENFIKAGILDATRREDWMKIGYSINNTFGDNGYALFDEYSKLTKENNYGEIEMYHYFQAREDGYNFGTIMNMAKSIDKDKYDAIVHGVNFAASFAATEAPVADGADDPYGEVSFVDPYAGGPADETYAAKCMRLFRVYASKQDKTDNDHAMIAVHLARDIVRVFDDFYVYRRMYWEKMTTPDVDVYMSNTLRSFVKSIQSQTTLTSPHAAETNDMLRIILKKANTTITQKAIRAQFTKFDPKHGKHFRFDILRPTYYCFENIAYDLKTNQPVQITREDYITQTTQYDYIEPSDELVDHVAGFFESTLPDPVKRACVISCLRSAMVGKNPEKFVMFYGKGGNGKGLINELLEAMLGLYFYKANMNTLTKDWPEGANVNVANMHMKRCTVWVEPKEGAKILSGQFKELTGGGEVNARTLHSKDTRTLLTHTCFMEANNKPKFDCELKDDIRRRFIYINFTVSFTEERNPDGSVPDGYKAANPAFKGTEFKEKYKCALFKYLMRFSGTDIVVPPCIQRETMAYLFDADDFSAYLSEKFEFDGIDGAEVEATETLNYVKKKYEADHPKEKPCSRDAFLAKMQSNLKYGKFFTANYVGHKTLKLSFIKKMRERSNIENET
jgi:phage/plasmid-associated DNA primase